MNKYIVLLYLKDLGQFFYKCFVSFEIYPCNKLKVIYLFFGHDFNFQPIGLLLELNLI